MYLFITPRSYLPSCLWWWHTALIGFMAHGCIIPLCSGQHTHTHTHTHLHIRVTWSVALPLKTSGFHDWWREMVGEGWDSEWHEIHTRFHIYIYSFGRHFYRWTQTEMESSTDRDGEFYRQRVLQIEMKSSTDSALQIQIQIQMESFTDSHGEFNILMYIYI